MRILYLLLAAACWLSTPACAVENTTPDIISGAARLYLDDYVAGKRAEGYDVTFSLGSLDPRLNLAPCPDGPSVEFTGDPMETTQTTLSVSCSGQRPWRLFISAEIEIKGPGLVAARPLSRGDRISADMIATQQVIINSVRRGAITEQTTLVGLELRRSMNTGTVFTPDLVTRPDAVARGDHVIIVARSGPIAVESRGKALGNGRIGEQVLIQNLRSSRTLRATITAPGKVEVPM